MSTNRTELIAKEWHLRKRMQRAALALWVAGGIEIATLPYQTGNWSLLNAGLLLIVIGCGFWAYGSIRYHGRSIDEAYRLGYDLGYEIGWHAREFEDTGRADERPLSPRKLG